MHATLLRRADSRPERVPGLDHLGLVLVPHGAEKELLHHNNRVLDLAWRDGGTERDGRRVEALRQGLHLVAQLRLELRAQLLLHELGGGCADLQQETGELGAELAPGCAVFPPLGTLRGQLGGEAGVILVIGDDEEVLHKQISGLVSGHWCMFGTCEVLTTDLCMSEGESSQEPRSAPHCWRCCLDRERSDPGSCE